MLWKYPGGLRATKRMFFSCNTLNPIIEVGTIQTRYSWYLIRVANAIKVTQNRQNEVLTNYFLHYCY